MSVCCTLKTLVTARGERVMQSLPSPWSLKYTEQITQEKLTVQTVFLIATKGTDTRGTISMALSLRVAVLARILGGTWGGRWVRAGVQPWEYIRVTQICLKLGPFDCTQD